MFIISDLEKIKNMSGSKSISLNSMISSELEGYFQKQFIDDISDSETSSTLSLNDCSSSSFSDEDCEDNDSIGSINYDSKPQIKNSHVGITTRGGKARILEYDLNDGLISKEESKVRILVFLIILGFVCCTLFTFLVIIIYVFASNDHNLSDRVLDEFPVLNLYMMSTMSNGEVFVNPILVQKSISIKYEIEIKNEFTVCY